MEDQAATLPVVGLCGPTASGKTDLALRIAEQIPVSIISVDSVLVYRGLDIGSAKPDAATLERFPHELVDIIDPTESYSVERFCQDAMAAIARADAAGRLPLLVGGTHLYFQALFEGLSPLPPTTPDIRAEVARLAKRYGWPEMHRRMAQFDPEAAARVHPNDPQRIGRAWEVYQATGVSLSQWQQTHPPRSPLAGRSAIRFALWPTSRAHAREAVRVRFMAMLEAGFVEEVAGLLAKPGLTMDKPAMRAVGYRQIAQYLQGDISFDRMVETAVTATRQLAKRQMTWMRGNPLLHDYSVDQRAALEQKIISLVS